MKIYRVTQNVNKVYSLSFEAPTPEKAIEIFASLLKSDPEALSPDTVDIDFSAELENAFQEDTPGEE